MPLHHCVFFKPIINNLKSFISGTSDFVLTSFFLLERGRLEDVFWARPLKIGHSKLNTCDVCSIEAHLEVFSGCVPEETHIDADYHWKTTQSW